MRTSVSKSSNLSNVIPANGLDDVVHQREISIQNEMDDIFVIKKGINVDDRIVLEGLRQVRDGEKVE